MNADPLTALFALEQFGIKFGLDNILAIAAALGHPERTFRSVHVAGTNGKGSVTAMVDETLRTAGHLTGRYTSPHLTNLAERFVIDGRPVAQQALRDAVADVHVVVDRLRHDGTLPALPTFFEVTTAVAFELFRRAEIEIAVCEVGLGGRLDATNILEPVVTAITSIGFDHEDYLGRTLPKIAAEKAGIIKPGVPVVVGPMRADALAEIELIAAARGAPMIRAYDGTNLVLLEPSDSFVNRFQVRTPVRDYGEVTLALAGGHQVHNAIVAIRLLETLDAGGIAVPAAAIVDSLACVSWPARLELRRLPNGRDILLDAAHNTDGAAALAAFLQANHFAAPPIVFAAMRDKDIAGMLSALAPVAGAFVFTRAATARAADPEELAHHAQRVAPGVPCEIEPRLGAALAAAWRRSPRIVAAGSIFLLGDVLRELGEA